MYTYVNVFDPLENRSTFGYDRHLDAVESVLFDRQQRHETVHEPDRKHLHRFSVRNRETRRQKHNSPILRQVKFNGIINISVAPCFT